jgi:ABC-type transport system substrate-binding protein
LAAFRTRQIDFTSVTDRIQLEDLLATNPDILVQVYAPNTTYSGPWCLQMKDPLLQDVRVRRALSLAINRQEMVEVLVGGWGSPSHPVVYTWLGRRDPLDWSELGPWQQYNPTLAKQLLAEAGYANGFELEKVVSGNPSDRDLMMAKYLEAIGVHVRFVSLEATVVTATRQEKRFRHAIDHTSQTGYDAIKLVREWYLPDSPRNWGSINDPVMTDLVERASYTLDPDEQRRLLWEINARELDQVYSIQPYTAFTIHVRQPYLFNVASAVQGYFNAWGYHQVRYAWIDDTGPAGRAGRLRT